MPVRVRDPFDHSRSMEVLADQPRYAPAGNKPYYVWDGRKYPRVTAVLSIAPGQRLMHYSAKVAALAAAAPLVHAGLYTPQHSVADLGVLSQEVEISGDEFDFDDGSPTQLEALHDETMAELERYVDAEAMRLYSAEEAISRACNWRDNMLAPDRYRDHKGRIGSLAHFYKHELAIGIHSKRPTVEYLAALATDRGVIPAEVFARFEQWGKSSDSVIMDLAHHALPHALNLWDFVEAYQPEYEMVGLEALAVNRSQEYAGSLDDWAWYSQARWREQNSGRWPFDPSLKRARVIGDLKTSNHLSSSVRFQLAAYAKAEFIGDFRDKSENSMPEFDGMIALHSKPDEGISITPWAAHCIEPAFDAFTHLNAYFRAIASLPRASQGRQMAPQKRGSRDCPIFVGGSK